MHDYDDEAYNCERNFKLDNSRPYCVISPYSGTGNKELYKRSWFETEEEAQRYAAKCLADKKSGSIVVVKAISLVSLPLPAVEITRFNNKEVPTTSSS